MDGWMDLHLCFVILKQRSTKVWLPLTFRTINSFDQCVATLNDTATFVHKFADVRACSVFWLLSAAQSPYRRRSWGRGPAGIPGYRSRQAHWWSAGSGANSRRCCSRSCWRSPSRSLTHVATEITSVTYRQSDILIGGPFRNRVWEVGTDCSTVSHQPPARRRRCTRRRRSPACCGSRERRCSPPFHIRPRLRRETQSSVVGTQGTIHIKHRTKNLRFVHGN